MRIIKNNTLFYKCFTCKKIKDPSKFYKNKSYRCKLCFKEFYKINKENKLTYYQKNKGKILKKYRENKLKLSQYYFDNSDKIKKRVYEWKLNNKDKVRRYKRKARLRSSSDIRQKTTLW